MNANAQDRLVQALFSMFSGSELESETFNVEPLSAMRREVNWHRPELQVVQEFVAKVTARGPSYIISLLWMMYKKRPGRRHDIDAVATALGYNPKVVQRQPSRNDFNTIFDALKACFSLDELQLIARNMGAYNSIPWGGNLGKVAFDMIEWCERHGYLEMLVLQMVEANRNPQVLALVGLNAQLPSVPASTAQATPALSVAVSGHSYVVPPTVFTSLNELFGKISSFRAGNKTYKVLELVGKSFGRVAHAKQAAATKLRQLEATMNANSASDPAAEDPFAKMAESKKPNPKNKGLFAEHKAVADALKLFDEAVKDQPQFNAAGAVAALDIGEVRPTVNLFTKAEEYALPVGYYSVLEGLEETLKWLAQVLGDQTCGDFIYQHSLATTRPADAKDDTLLFLATQVFGIVLPMVESAKAQIEQSRTGSEAGVADATPDLDAF